MDRYYCWRVDDLRVCAPGGQDAAQSLDRRFVLVVAGTDGGRRFLVDGVWLFYRQSLGIFGQHLYVALSAGAVICEAIGTQAIG